MGGHPGVKGMLVIRVLGTDRFETGKVLRIELWEQGRGRHAILQPRPRDQQGHHHAQGIDHQMPLAPVDLLAAIIAALSPAPLRRCDRWAVDARRTRRRRPTRLPAGLFSPGL
jgi:hypothetical protein